VMQAAGRLYLESESPMRVVHILGELRRSGAEMMYRSAEELWRSLDIQTEMIATGETPGEMAAELERSGVRIHHLPFSRTPGHVLKMARFLREQRYDVVHLNTERGSFWYGVAATATPGTRVLRTIHSVFAFRGALRVRRKLQRLVLRRLGVRSIAVSRSVQQMELERFGNPTELVSNWIDHRRFHVATEDERKRARKLLGVPDEAFVVSTVASCAAVKNHMSVIRALAALRDEVPLIYLHAGREGCDGVERALAEELKVSERIRFLGLVEDVLPVLHASDAFAMPSFHEGCSIAAIEAMAAGIPSILSRVNGLRDFEDALPGILWVDTTPDSIAEALRQLYATPHAERAESGRRLSEAAHRHYGLGNGAQRYAELYKGCCS